MEDDGRLQKEIHAMVDRMHGQGLEMVYALTKRLFYREMKTK